MQWQWWPLWLWQRLHMDNTIITFVWQWLWRWQHGLRGHLHTYHAPIATLLLQWRMQRKLLIKRKKYKKYKKYAKNHSFLHIF